MSEAMRQAYLQAMGLDSYVPRFALPGALPSHLLDEGLEPPTDVNSRRQERVKPADTTTTKDTATAAATSALEEAKLFIDGLSPNKSVQQRAATADQDIAKKADITEQTAPQPVVAPPEFSLSMAVLQGKILLLDDCYPEQHGDEEYRRLLHNIVAALGLKPVALEILSFQWPLHTGGVADNSAAAASETLQAFLQRQLEKSSAGYLLLMGAATQQYAISAAQPIPESFAQGQLSRFQQLPPTLATVSASACLDEPLLKKQLWQQLQPLRLALQVA